MKGAERGGSFKERRQRWRRERWTSSNIVFFVLIVAFRSGYRFKSTPEMSGILKGKGGDEGPREEIQVADYIIGGASLAEIQGERGF